MSEKAIIEHIDRVTGIESLLSCPHKSVTIPRKSDVDYVINTTMGNLWHLAHRHPDLAEVMARKFFGETMIKLTGQRDNVNLNIMLQVIEFGRQWIKDRAAEGYIVYSEASTVYTMNRTLMTWQYDELLIHPFNWTFHLNDFKVIKNISPYYAIAEEGEDDTIQKLIIQPERKQVWHYSYLVFEDFPEINELIFSYVCYKKLKTVQQVIVSKVITREECYKMVEADIAEAEGYKDLWFYPCKKNSFCYSCPLYRADKAKELGLVQCPLYKQPEVEYSSVELL